MVQLIRHIREKIKRCGISSLVVKCFSVLHREGISGISWEISRMMVKEEAGREWVQLFNQYGDAYYKVLTLKVKTWPHKPLISIMVPVYNTPEKLAGLKGGKNA